MADTEPKDFFHEMCSPRFDHIDSSLREIKDMLKGEGMNPGLIDDVRNLKRSRANMIKVVWVFSVAFVTQFLIWLRSKIGL